MLKITLEVKPTIKAKYSPGIVDCKPLQTPMSSLRRNHSKHSLWTFGVYTVPCDPGSPCQMMIEVDNHLRNERYLGSITILRFGEPGSLQSTPVFVDSDRIHKLPWLSGWFFQGIPTLRKKGKNTPVSTNMTMKKPTIWTCISYPKMVIFQLAMLVYWRAYLPWIFARQHPPLDMWQDGVEGKHLFMMIGSDEGFREDFRYLILINIFLINHPLGFICHPLEGAGNIFYWHQKDGCWSQTTCCSWQRNSGRCFCLLPDSCQSRLSWGSPSGEIISGLFLVSEILT